THAGAAYASSAEPTIVVEGKGAATSRRLRSPPVVGIYVASYNTCAITRRCVESVLAHTRGDFELTVGDSSSRDGSVEMLREFEQRGALRLQVEAEPRMHAWWLDRWVTECPHPYAAFVDSDVVILRDGWLERLVRAADRRGAAIVAGELRGELKDYVGPAEYGSVTVRTAARPGPWLMLVRPEAIRRLGCSYAYENEHTDAVPEGVVAYDVGARVYQRALAAGLPVRIMPPWYRLRFYRHLRGGSWRR
ncbi:MAG TPA: glycosyltransferase family 2 protein, partial [Gaiellaceae bacterium]|nr:glycosyltransferase family 2 protein [Gaiellaceae bacterium]